MTGSGGAPARIAPVSGPVTDGAALAVALRGFHLDDGGHGLPRPRRTAAVMLAVHIAWAAPTLVADPCVTPVRRGDPHLL